MLNKSSMMRVQGNQLVYLFIQHNFCISYDFIIPRRIFLGKKKYTKEKQLELKKTIALQILLELDYKVRFLILIVRVTEP